MKRIPPLIMVFALWPGAHLDLVASDEAAAPAGPGAIVLERHDSVISIDVDPTAFTVGEKGVLSWVDIAIESVHAYYSRLPVPRIDIAVVPFEGGGVGRGTAFKTTQTPRIRMTLGTETTIEQLKNDWKLTHELVHLFVPRLSQRQSWLDEGIATYVEAIGRSKIGNVPEEQVWQWLVENVPHALEGITEGLDESSRWGTVYWGGALFCLLADIEIRQSSANQKGLRHALRGILAAGLPIGDTVTARDLLRAGDAAIDMETLSGLYEKYRARPFDVDADELLRRLGVSMIGGQVIFDDSAPLAEVRRAIIRD